MDSNECAVLNSQDAFDAWMSVVLPEGWRGGRYRPLELDAFGRLSLIAEVERVTGEPFTEALLDSLTTLDDWYHFARTKHAHVCSDHRWVES